MRSLLLFCLVLCSTFLSAQESLDEIIGGSPLFTDRVARGEAYFAAKHPGKSAEELSQGEFRDGNFVKFQRWQAYWSERLNPDGTLGDPTAYFRKWQPMTAAQKSNEPYLTVPWTNINYTDYIVSQIGLGRTDDIAFHPTDANTFYVAANRGGVWKTVDGGQTYVPLTDELPQLNVRSLVVDQTNPNTVYALFGEIGVYKSTDAGQSWNSTATNWTPNSHPTAREITADPTDPNRMLLVSGGGTYETTDGFATITQINSYNGYRVRFQPGNASVVLIGGRNGQIWRSTDGGSSYTQITTLSGNNAWIEFSDFDPNYAYASVNGGAFYQSADGGQSWSLQSTGNDGAMFHIAPGTRDVIVKGYFDIFRSNDGGQNFFQIMDWLGAGGLPSTHVDTRRIRTNPLEPDAVYFCNDGGVYRYSVSQNNFTNLSDGLVITQYYDIAVSQTDANIVGGGSQDNGNVYRQSDGSWLQYAGTGDGMNQAIDHLDATYRYWEYQNGGLRRWHNGSNTNIKPSGETGAWETPYKLDPINPSRIVAGFTSVYESFDRGDTWSNIGNNLAGGSTLNQMAIAPANTERIYVTQGSTIYVKAIDSDTWTNHSMPSSAGDLEVDPVEMDKIYIVQTGYSDGNKIWMSEDAGASWSNITANLPNVSFAAIETYDDIPGALFVGGEDGVFYTNPLLNNWQRYGDLPNTRVEDIEIQYAAQLIRVGTYGRGVLEAAIEVVACAPGAADTDEDGICDLIDECPLLDNSLIGTACDDGDPNSSGEKYDSDCGCSGGASNLTYCTAAGSSGTGSDYIQRVDLADLSNSSGQSFYSDFTDKIATVTTGETYTITVEFRSVFAPDRAHAWIDWNRNEVFDTDEHIAFSVPINSGAFYGEAYATVTVPEAIEEGVTTMRVRGVYSTTHLNPCGNAFGEIEDYTINVLCPAGVCAILPLDWVNFTARPLDKGRALINWSTAAEEGVDHFRIERSLHGIDFETVATVEAWNTVSASYEFIDETVTESYAYYRIVSRDLDGTESMTELQRVNWRDEAEGLRLFPNPVDGEGLTVNWAQEGAEYALIYNSYGQEVKRIVLATLLPEEGGGNAGESPVEVRDAKSVKIATNNLPAGVYLLRLRAKTWDETAGFIVR